MNKVQKKFWNLSNITTVGFIAICIICICLFINNFAFANNDELLADNETSQIETSTETQIDDVNDSQIDSSTDIVANDDNDKSNINENVKIKISWANRDVDNRFDIYYNATDEQGQIERNAQEFVRDNIPDESAYTVGYTPEKDEYYLTIGWIEQTDIFAWKLHTYKIFARMASPEYQFQSWYCGEEKLIPSKTYVVKGNTQITATYEKDPLVIPFEMKCNDALTSYNWKYYEDGVEKDSGASSEYSGFIKRGSKFELFNENTGQLKIWAYEPGADINKYTYIITPVNAAGTSFSKLTKNFGVKVNPYIEYPIDGGYEHCTFTYYFNKISDQLTIEGGTGHSIFKYAEYYLGSAEPYDEGEEPTINSPIYYNQKYIVDENGKFTLKYETEALGEVYRLEIIPVCEEIYKFTGLSEIPADGSDAIPLEINKEYTYEKGGEGDTMELRYFYEVAEADVSILNNENITKYRWEDYYVNEMINEDSDTEYQETFFAGATYTVHKDGSIEFRDKHKYPLINSNNKNEYDGWKTIIYPEINVPGSDYTITVSANNRTLNFEEWYTIEKIETVLDLKYDISSINPEIGPEPEFISANTTAATGDNAVLYVTVCFILLAISGASILIKTRRNSKNF